MLSNNRRFFSKTINTRFNANANDRNLQYIIILACFSTSLNVQFYYREDNRGKMKYGMVKHDRTRNLRNSRFDNLQVAG